MNISLKNWSLALRPWSLPASISPVIVGTAMAFGDGKGDALAALLALMVAIGIHLGTNVVNDIGDFRSGVDQGEQPGTINVIQAKIFSEKKMTCIATASFLIAIVTGLVAVMYRQAWALIPVGGISILAGIFYTSGPRPAAYLGLGEALVIVFFGPVTVAGTYFIQALTFSTPVILAGLACGLICSGILIINNYRDYDNDLRCNKRTLPVRLGRNFARWEYLTMWVIACLIPVIIFLVTGKPGVLLGSLTGLAAIPLIQTVLRTTKAAALNQALASNGKLLVLFSILFSFGWLIRLP